MADFEEMHMLALGTKATSPFVDAYWKKAMTFAPKPEDRSRYFYVYKRPAKLSYVHYLNYINTLYPSINLTEPTMESRFRP